MSKQPSFNQIGLISRNNNDPIVKTGQSLVDLLQNHQISVIAEERLASKLKHCKGASKSKIGEDCDLLITIGGDGSFLEAAQLAIEHDLPITGINRGSLGFLTDINPTQLEPLLEILNGDYIQENRQLISAQIIGPEALSSPLIAINDIVLSPGEVGRMIQFKLLTQQQAVSSYRADGLIIATPTGSTAYALSAGGPILTPGINALVIAPLSPHNLNSRPLVVANQSITIEVDPNNTPGPKLTLDGHQKIHLSAGCKIEINPYNKYLKLLHPTSYNYFETLRTKLGWGNSLK